MQAIHEIKGLEVTGTPLLLFECTLTSGDVERWSTHKATVGGFDYEPRVLRHNLFEIKASSEDGVDAASRMTLVLANADSRFSQIQRNIGWKGAKIAVKFAFYNVQARTSASDSTTVFQGICNPPDEITEGTIRLSFASRMNLQRLTLPQVRVQRRCPWVFPSNQLQRQEAVDGGQRQRFSAFYACGYSPDQTSGCGNFQPDGAPFTTCDYSRSACEQRGMFDHDTSGRQTRRFGGIEYLPSTIAVRTYGEKLTHISGAVENESKYNDNVPLVYGTAWYRPPVVFARNDGNLTRMEVLLGSGEIEGVLKVLVNGIELPAGSNAYKPAATGWYNLVTHGERNGGFNLDFTENGRPAGDPYGSMAMMAVVVPNRISDGSPLPRVDVLVNGLKVAVWNSDGTYAGEMFTNNPAWVILDIMRRSGWSLEEVDLDSFIRSAAYCGEVVPTTDLNGNHRDVPRFQSNVALRRRRSAADVIRGIRTAAGLFLTYGAGGLLQLNPESSIALQQPERPPGSNSTEMLNGGWPAYEFGDGSSPFSDLIRKESGEPAVRMWCRSTAETPNRLSVEFQDEFNDYQQDSLSLVDLEDSLAAGQEISASLTALGLPNFNQAGRVMRAALDRSLRGNNYIEFETGLRGFGLKPGDIITVTYAKEGLARQPFRIQRIAPGRNFQTSTITAQWHDDTWYTGGAGALGLIGGGRQPATEIGIPRPLGGSHFDEHGEPGFGVVESYRERADGSWDVDLSVSFSVPSRPGVDAPPVPLVSLAPQVRTSGGTLAGGRSYYYAVSTVADDGSESPLSFVVRASVPEGSDSNEVTLQGLSFGAGTASFHVYRGLSPVQILRIAEFREPSVTFTDSGADATTAAPPDQNFHHANFYWRHELLPEQLCSAHSATSVGHETLGLEPNEFRGKVVRITGGTGRGQERVISGNDRTTITVTRRFEPEPDGTSRFCVAEAGWNFGAVSESSPVVFTVPNHSNAAIHISGRSANVNDRECAYELSPLSRHVIGGGAEDADVPDAPVFGLSSTGRGTVEISAIGFQTTANLRSVTSATLMLHCWNELDVATERLAAAVDPETTRIFLSNSGIESGTLLQAGSEILEVISAIGDDDSYEVRRGGYGSVASSHTTDTPVYVLHRRVTVLPFARGFFGSPASGSYSHPILMPNQRVVVAELFVTNARGNSQVTGISYAGLESGGLRTLSGGQITMQMEGSLAILSDAVPPTRVDTARAVRDVFASLSQAPTGGDVLLRVRSGADTFCELTIASGQTVSDSIDGAGLSPLDPNKPLSLAIVSLPQGGNSAPGAGLTVTIRF